jgi:hypothetical protein
MLDVEGIVDSTNYENDLEARAKGKWANLASWLKDNDKLVKSRF